MRVVPNGSSRSPTSSLSTFKFSGRRTSELADDYLTIARRRMRHLAAWRVEPLPTMHAAIGHPTKALSTEQRTLNEHLAIQVLAVQMWLTNSQSAMQ